MDGVSVGFWCGIHDAFLSTSVRTRHDFWRRRSRRAPSRVSGTGCVSPPRCMTADCIAATDGTPRESHVTNLYKHYIILWVWLAGTFLCFATHRLIGTGGFFPGLRIGIWDLGRQRYAQHSDLKFIILFTKIYTICDRLKGSAGECC